MEDISSMWKYCLMSSFAIGILVLLYRFFYMIDGFYINGCPGGSVWNEGAKACRDPDCKPGQKGTRGPSGMICANLSNPTFTPTSQADCPSGTTFDTVGKRCNVCTTLPDGTTQCRSQGAYDIKPTFVQGSINPETVRTDVLTNPGEIDYADWMDDPTTSSDLRGSGGNSSFLRTHYIDGSTKLIKESDADKPYDTLEDDYNDATDERNYSDDDEEYITERTYNRLVNNRKTPQELIESARRRAKIYDRYTERPSDMDYDEYDVYYYDEDTEGFATRL